MTAPALLDSPRKPKRVVASKAAVKAAIAAARECGLSVEGMLITGGKIELRLSGVEEADPSENDGGLEKW